MCAAADRLKAIKPKAGKRAFQAFFRVAGEHFWMVYNICKRKHKDIIAFLLGFFNKKGYYY